MYPGSLSNSATRDHFVDRQPCPDNQGETVKNSRLHLHLSFFAPTSTPAGGVLTRSLAHIILYDYPYRMVPIISIFFPEILLDGKPFS